MAIRTRVGVSVILSSTTAEAKDLGNGVFEAVTDSIGEGGSRKITLAASATDVQVSLCDVADAALLFIRAVPSNQNDDAHEVVLKLNSPLGESIRLVPLGTTKQAYFLLTTTGLAEVYATNTGTTAMSLIISVAGD